MIATAQHAAGAHQGPGAFVYFATIAAGGGHVATANALAEAVREVRGGAARTDVVDVMKEFGFGGLDARHKESWRRLLKRPWLVRAGQRVMDAAPALVRASQNAFLASFARVAAERLNALAPDLVVANHGWLATSLTLARRKYGLVPPVLVFATEPFDASALWAEPHVDAYLAPSAAAAADLTRFGVPQERLRVVGYPVRAPFLSPPTREAARERLTLGDEFVCLLSLGAEGVSSDALTTVDTLLARGATVLAVAGRNAALKDALDARARTSARLRPFGFTNEMPALLAAADVMVGKAGPASVMEALAVGTPVVVTGYAGLNERRVTRFVVSRGVGSHAPGPGGVAAALAPWEDPARRADAREVTRSLDFAGMSARAAGAVLTYATTGALPTTTAAPLRPFEAVTAESLRKRV